MNDTTISNDELQQLIDYYEDLARKFTVHHALAEAANTIYSERKEVKKLEAAWEKSEARVKELSYEIQRLELRNTAYEIFEKNLLAVKNAAWELLKKLPPIPTPERLWKDEEFDAAEVGNAILALEKAFLWADSDDNETQATTEP